MRKRMMLAAALLLAFAAAPAAAGSTSSALPDDLARALEAYNRATIHKDTATLSTLVTDDYVLVNSDTSVQDKRSYLADFAARGFSLEPYVIEQPVYKVRGDAALTGGSFKLSWTQDGRHESRRLRIAHFWVKNDGKWRIAYTQLTRVPE